MDRFRGVTTYQRPLIKRSTPINKLSEEDRNDIIKIATSSECEDLPSSKVATKLADKCEYKVLESRFYRILKEEKLNANRISSKKASKNIHQLISKLCQMKPGRLLSLS